jgi:hypothetical protein
VLASGAPSPCFGRAWAASITSSPLPRSGFVQHPFSDASALPPGSPGSRGFYRASSNPTPFGGGTNLAAIDDWSVTFFSSCTTGADCDDGDACTTDDCVDGVCRVKPIECADTDPCTVDACSGGTCTNAPLDCNDGRDCSYDYCANGICYSYLAVDFATVEAKIPLLLAILEGPSCSGDLIAKKIARKIRKKVKRAGARIVSADDATKPEAIHRLLTKAATLLDAADGIPTGATTSGLVSPQCAIDLGAYLLELGQCVFRLPQG